MPTLKLKAVGGLVKVEYTGEPDRYISPKTSFVNFQLAEDGSIISGITIGNVNYPASAFTDVQVDGVAIVDQADFDIQIAKVFPDEGGGSSTPGYLEYVALLSQSGTDAPVDTGGVLEGTSRTWIRDAAGGYYTVIPNTSVEKVVATGNNNDYAYSGNCGDPSIVYAPQIGSDVWVLVQTFNAGVLTDFGTAFGQLVEIKIYP